MLQILAHAHLPHTTRQPQLLHTRTHLSHEAVLVAVHARELADVRKRVLQTVGELKRIDVAQPILQTSRYNADNDNTNTTYLHVRVDNQLGQSQNFATLHTFDV
jgi:hypothetical protein